MLLLKVKVKIKAKNRLLNSIFAMIAVMCNEYALHSHAWKKNNGMKQQNVNFKDAGIGRN